MSDAIKQISMFTWALRHNPHCPSPYKVYMVGRRKGRINYDINDIIGHGKTLDEAIENALKEKGVHEAHT